MQISPRTPHSLGLSKILRLLNISLYRVYITYGEKNVEVICSCELIEAE